MVVENCSDRRRMESRSSSRSRETTFVPVVEVQGYNNYNKIQVGTMSRSSHQSPTDPNLAGSFKSEYGSGSITVGILSNPRPIKVGA